MPQSEQPHDPQFLRVPHVARRLDCSASFVYKLIDRGVLIPVRLGEGGAIRIPVEQIDRLGQQVAS